MSIQDSGMDVVIELSHEYVCRILANLVRNARMCPPLSFNNLPNPFNPAQTLSAVELIPQLKSVTLRQTVTAGVQHVYIDVTFEPSIGTLSINGAPASEVTLSAELSAAVASGQLTIQPNLGLVAAFVPVTGVTLNLDLLNDKDFSLTAIAVGLELVGPEQNLAVGLDMDMKGTLRQFSGDCKKSTTSLTNANLNGSAANLATFYTTYDTAFLPATFPLPLDVAIALDEAVLNAKIKSVSIDQPGILENTRLSLISTGPNEMRISGQACVFQHIDCVGDWWDSGFEATAQFKVQSGSLLVNYTVDKAYLTDTDSGFDTCISALNEMKKKGLDKGTKDLHITGVFGKSSDATGRIAIQNVAYRDHDAVLYARSDLETLDQPSIEVPSELVISTGCHGETSYDGEFTIKHDQITAAPLHVCQLRLEKDAGQAFQILEPTAGFDLKYGQSQKVTVRCMKAAGQNYTADLRILSNGGVALTHIQALLAPAQVAVPTQLDLRGSSYWDLCAETWFDYRSQKLELANNGPGALKVCSLAVENDPAGYFTADTGTLPTVVKPGSSLFIIVTYTIPVSELDQEHAAQLKIRASHIVAVPSSAGTNAPFMMTFAGSLSVDLIGKLEHKYDLQFHGIGSSYAKQLLCGKIHFVPPTQRDFPADLLRDYAHLILPPERPGLLFLEISLRNAPRRLIMELMDERSVAVATVDMRGPTKSIFIPHTAGEEHFLRFTPGPSRAEQDARFSVRNWYFGIEGRLDVGAPIHDFALRKRHIFVCTDDALHVAVMDEREPRTLASRREWNGARAATVVADRLLLARDGCEVLDVALPAEPVPLGRFGLDDGIQGLYNPDPHLHHVDAGIVRSRAFAELAYAFGQRLHVLRLLPEGGGEIAATLPLAEPGFRAQAWGQRLFVVGQHTLQIFGIANPFAPVALGAFHSKAEISNVQILGCQALLINPGPAVTLVEISRPERPRVVGEYNEQLAIKDFFPSRGPIFVANNNIFTLDASGSGVLVGRLFHLPLDQELIARRRRQSEFG